MAFHHRMSTQTPICPKCSKRMEEGFIIDNMTGGAVPSLWVEGAPERSIWTGLKVFERTIRIVVSNRCTGCGYLESFAAEKWTGRIEPSKK